MGYPKMDGLEWKVPLKIMIWEYLYFTKPPYFTHLNDISKGTALSGLFHSSESCQ